MLLVPKYKYHGDIDINQADSIMKKTFKEERKRKTGNYSVERWKI